MNRILQSILFLFLGFSPALCQETDTVSAPLRPAFDTVFQRTDSMIQLGNSDFRFADTLHVEQLDFSHSASRAIMYALVLPGLGQGYNKKYFKIPFVYAAIGTMGYFIVYNTRNYQEASRNYALLQDDTNERYLRGWRRNLEVSYIGLILVYALQVVDAYVDAQLYSWDVNDNLSFRVAPSLQPMLVTESATRFSYGLSCSFDLKRR